ncbi:hypothetical protein ACXR2W_03710 [Leucobacter sp. HY1908]
MSSVKWNFAWQRHHSIARAAAAGGTPVVFVEPHPRALRQVTTHVRRRLPGGSAAAAATPAPQQRVPAGVTVLRWSPADLFPWVSTRRVRRALPTGSVNFVLQYVPSRKFLTLARALRPTVHAYDRVLDWQRVPPNWYPPRGWALVEAQLEREAALVTDAAAMQQAWADRGHRSLLITPAADDEFVQYAWSPAPAAGPIGYFGTVQENIIDLPLLCRVAATRAVEVIGDVDAASRAQLTAAGVTVRPAVPVGELPPHIDNWAAILLPYRVGDRRDSLVPAKIWNALATGRPVLTSGLTLPPDIAQHTFDVSAAGETDETSDRASKLSELLAPTAAPTLAKVPSWSDAWRDLLDFTGHPLPS